MPNKFKIKRGSVTPTNSANIDNYELVYNYTDNELWTKHNGSVVQITSNTSGTVTNVVTENGISGGPITSTGTIGLNFSTLTDMTGDISGTTEFILQNGTVESRKAASEIKLTAFDATGFSISGAVDTSGTPIAQEYARFTDANTVEGRSYAGVRTDLGLVVGTNVQAQDTLLQDIADFPTSNAGNDGKVVTYQDSDGTLVLSTPSAGTITSVSGMTNNNVLTASGSTTISGESSLQFGGSHLKLLVDNGKFLAGADEDAYFMHSGTHAWLNNSTGNLYIRNQTDDGQIIMQTDDGSGGTTTYMSLKGNEQLIRILKSTRYSDNILAQFGTGNDFSIKHDGSHNIMKLSNGNLYFRDQSNNNIFQIYREGGGIQLSEGDLKIPATSKLYLDGGSDTYIDEPGGDQLRLVAGGTEVLKGYSSGAIDMYGGSTQTRSINIGANRSGNGYSYIDLVGDATYSDFGARFIRENTGPNTGTAIEHRGTGVLSLNAKDAGSVRFYTSNTERVRVDSSGNVSIGNFAPAQKLHVDGSIRTDLAYYVDSNIVINTDGNFEVHDTRAVTPSTDLGLKGVRFDFKNNSADGLSDGGSYHGVMTFQQWADSSGGHIHALGFTDNGYVHHRNASIGGTFGNWKKLIQEDESANVGIGEVAPASKLQVQYTTTSNGSAAIAEFGESGTGAIANSGHQVIIGGPNVSGYTGAMIYSDSTSGVGIISFADGRGANDSWRGMIQYEHSNDAMTFSTNTSEKMRISSDGKVHIGSTSATHKFHVTSGTSNSAVRIDADVARGANRYALDVQDDDGNNRGTARFRHTGGSGNPALIIAEGYDHSYIFQSKNTSASDAEQFRIEHYDGNVRMNSLRGTLALQNTGGGNIGVGTTVPGALFTVKKDGTQASSVSGTFQIQTVSNSNGGIAIQAGASSHGYIVFGDNGDYDAGKIGYDNANHNLKFFTNNSEKVRLTSAGNVGIGNASPAALLDVGGDADTFALIGRAKIGYFGYGDYAAFGHRDGSTAEYALLQFTDGTTYLNTGSGSLHFRENNSTKMHLTGGNLGIGITSPSASLHINTTNDASVFLTRDGGHSYSLEHDTSQLYLYNRTINKSVLEFEHSGPVVINEQGHSTVDFRVEGDTNAYLLFTDASADRVGINASSPAEQFHVGGTSFFNGQLYGGFGAVTTGGTTDWNHSINARSGNGHTLLLSTATNGPGTTAVNSANNNYYHTLSFEYASNDNDGNMTQIGIPYYFANNDGVRPVIRARYNGTWSAYNNLITGNANGQIEAAAGTEALPSYSFNGNGVTDLDTGIYRRAANQIGFSVAAHDQFYVSDGAINIEQPVRIQFANDQRLFDDGGGGLKVGSQYNQLTLFGGTNTGEMRFLAGGRNGTEKVRFDASGNGHFVQDVVAYSSTPSDIRLKKNFTKIDNGLDVISKLDGQTFNWKKDDGRLVAGFKAQEVEKVLPHLVNEKKLPLHSDDDKDYKVLRYEELIPYLVEAIKEQQVQIDELKTKLGE